MFERSEKETPSQIALFLRKDKALKRGGGKRKGIRRTCNAWMKGEPTTELTGCRKVSRSRDRNAINKQKRGRMKDLKVKKLNCIAGEKVREAGSNLERMHFD